VVTSAILQRELKRISSPKKAQNAARFFKTGKGEYGEGDRFIGVTVPQIRAIAKVYAETSVEQVCELLKSPIHEARLLALLLLGMAYDKKRTPAERSSLVGLYLKHREWVNNWDLVDSSAYRILGTHALQTGDTSRMNNLILSKRHWDRRMAMVATLAFIRVGNVEITFDFAERCLDDREDLMHKACGWMLREAGKRDESKLRKFIREFGSRMPRTMLRYAIEKFSVAERKKILSTTKPSRKERT